MRGQLASGAAVDDLDYFASLTSVMQDGFREQSDQKNIRFSGNVCYRMSETAETRLYLTYNKIDQEIPGSVSRRAALRSPEDARAGNIRGNNKRDIESFRIASKTTLALDLLRGIWAGGPEPDALWLRQAYTYSDFELRGDDTFGDNELPGAPEHYYRGELAYDHPIGLQLSMNVEWVPRAYFVDNANTVETEPYKLLGLKARYEVFEGLSAFIEVRNLLDEEYISSTSVVPVATRVTADEGGDELFNPGEGRAIYLGVELRR